MRHSAEPSRNFLRGQLGSGHHSLLDCRSGSPTCFAAAAPGSGFPHQLRAMTRTRKWVSCACGHNWAWQRQVETGEDTHCTVCGRNWRKQLSKQQSSKDRWATNSPRAVWEAGRSSGIGKGAGKGPQGQPGPLGGKVGNVLAGLWKDFPRGRAEGFPGGRVQPTSPAWTADPPPPASTCKASSGVR